jgi:hypothetical protein
MSSAKLLCFVSNEKNIDRCLFLVFLHFTLTNDTTSTMLAVCELLLERLPQMSHEYVVEAATLHHITFEAIQKR